MGQYFLIFNLDGEFASKIGKYGENYMVDFDWLMDLIATPDQQQHPSSTSGSWANNRLICLGDYACDVPKHFFSDTEVFTLQQMGIDSSDIYEKVASQAGRPRDVRSSLILKNDTSWALVNTCKKEYISVDVIEQLAVLDGAQISIGSVLLSRICWSSDPSMSMTYQGFKHKSGVLTELYRGAWAGDRFVFAPLNGDSLKDHIDVTSEVCLEIKAIWTTEGYEFEENPSPDDRIGLWHTEKHHGQYWASDPLPEDVTDDELMRLSLPGLSFSRIKRTSRVIKSTRPIPSEILAKIFQQVLFMGEPVDEVNDESTSENEQGENSGSRRSAEGKQKQYLYPSSRLLLYCSHVCGSWREAALGAAKLWRYLSSLDSLQETRAFISRSKSLPLEVYFEEVSSSSDKFWELIAGHTERLGALKLLTATDFLPNLLQVLNHDVKSLTTLKVSSEQFSSDAFVEVLRNTTALEYLELSLLDFDDIATSWPSISFEVHTLCKLRCLKLHAANLSIIRGLFTSFKLPLLSELIVSTSSPQNMPSSFFEFISETPKLQFEQVQSLNIQGKHNVTFEVLVQLFASFPNIVSCSLDNVPSSLEDILLCHLSNHPEPEGYTVICRCRHRFHGQFNFKKLSPKSVPWPKLHALTLYTTGITALTNFIYYRQALEVDALKLYFGGPLAGVFPDNKIKWFRERLIPGQVLDIEKCPESNNAWDD